MEQDRYQVNSQLYIVGIISLVLAMILLLFSAFLLPYILFGWVYDVPSFIIQLVHRFEFDLGFSHLLSTLFVWLIFLVPGFIFGLLAYYASNSIDEILFHVKPEEVESTEMVLSIEQQRERRRSITFGLKILFLIVMVFILASIFELLLYIEPPQ